LSLVQFIKTHSSSHHKNGNNFLKYHRKNISFSLVQAQVTL